MIYSNEKSLNLVTNIAPAGWKHIQILVWIKANII